MIFSQVLYKKHVMKKNPGVFYGQIWTIFSFSEFWLTDFRHNKFQKKKKNPNGNTWQIFKNLLWRNSVIQSFEKLKLVKLKLVHKILLDFFFQENICVSYETSEKIVESWDFTYNAILCVCATSCLRFFFFFFFLKTKFELDFFSLWRLMQYTK
jgi:hypothetical protein